MTNGNILELIASSGTDAPTIGSLKLGRAGIAEIKSAVKAGLCQLDHYESMQLRDRTVWLTRAGEAAVANERDGAPA